MPGAHCTASGRNSCSAFAIRAEVSKKENPHRFVLAAPVEIQTVGKIWSVRIGDDAAGLAIWVKIKIS